MFDCVQQLASSKIKTRLGFWIFYIFLVVNDVRSHLDKLEEFMEGRKKDTAKILKGEKDSGIFGTIPMADGKLLS